MSTRAVIAVYTNRREGCFRGVYHHFDGYPSGLGQSLWALYQEHFKLFLPAMIELLIDAHPHGWSSIVDADWSQRPTWIDDKSDYYHEGRKLPPLSYKYRPGEEPAPLDETSSVVQDWAYVFDLRDNSMTILRAIPPWSSANYVKIVSLNLDGSEPDWKSFE